MGESFIIPKWKTQTIGHHSFNKINLIYNYNKKVNKRYER